MAKFTIQTIGRSLRKKRGDRGLRETAEEIGISAATLSRVERGRSPDLDTFAKVCAWLEIDPARVLGMPQSTAASSVRIVTAHFRADQNLSPKAAHALANMILLAQQMMIGTDK